MLVKWGIPCIHVYIHCMHESRIKGGCGKGRETNVNKGLLCYNVVQKLRELLM